MNANPRRLAVKVIARVLRQRAYSHIALHSALASVSISPPDRAMATRLVYGTITWLRPIDAILNQHLRRGVQHTDPVVVDILRVAVFQLGWLDRIPPHAAVDQAVRHAKKVRPRAAGLVNGVLRSALREQKKWPATGHNAAPPGTADALASAWSLPDWLARRWCTDFGIERSTQMAASLAELPPLTLRVRDATATSLGTPGLTPNARRAPRWTPEITKALEGGQVAVQDEAAQLVGLLANPNGPARILDGCAGQGGKTLHLLDLADSAASVVASDPYQKKLDRIPADPRLTTVAGDLREASVGSLGGPKEGFDLLVVDAPCSGLGVIRRHPETRWTRTEADITSLVTLQSEILANAIRLVRPGGHLVYAVCTVTPEEGEQQIARLVSEHTAVSLDLDGGSPAMDWTVLHRSTHGFLVLPQDHGSDGFFLSRLAIAAS